MTQLYLTFPECKHFCSNMFENQVLPRSSKISGPHESAHSPKISGPRELSDLYILVRCFSALFGAFLSVPCRLLSVSGLLCRFFGVSFSRIGTCFVIFCRVQSGLIGRLVLTAEHRRFWPCRSRLPSGPTKLEKSTRFSAKGGGKNLQRHDKDLQGICKTY